MSEMNIDHHNGQVVLTIDGPGQPKTVVKLEPAAAAKVIGGIARALSEIGEDAMKQIADWVNSG